MSTSTPASTLRGLSLLLAFNLLCLQGFAQTLPEPPKVANLFEFHSGFWVNMHHFLYAQALSQSSRPHRGGKIEPADLEEFSGLSGDELAAWKEALAYYSGSMIQRDLLFDHDLASIKDRLGDAELSPSLADVDIPTDLKAVLVHAASVYRKHWWKRHDNNNQRWISETRSLVTEHGASLSKSVVEVFEVPWPGDHVRVDVVSYANWAGAYTTIKPTRPTISSYDPENQSTGGLEVLFHETSHGMMDRVMSALDAAEKPFITANPLVKPPWNRDLFHEVLFYTCGELVKERIPEHVPVADRGIWERAWPGPDRSLVEKDWKPHILGEVSLDAALRKLVVDIANAKAQTAPETNRPASSPR